VSRERKPRVPRAKRLERVLALREKGLTIPECAHEMGFSDSYIRDLLYDPDGAKGKARKERYGSTCADCGGPTSGGRGGKHPPIRCAHCSHNRPRKEPVRPPSGRRCACGTILSQYNANTACWPCINSRTRKAQERAGHFTMNERRDAIVVELEQRSLSVLDLAERLHIVEKTLREDLLALIRDERVERGDKIGGFRMYRAAVDADELMREVAA
jgi:hypothetical protein